MYKNGHNFATGLPIDVLFGSRVGFSGTAELMVQLSNFKNTRWRYTRTAVARNPCVSWPFLLLHKRTFINWMTFKPPPPVGTGGGYMFSGRPSVPLSVRPCVRDSRGSFMLPRYLQYLLTDFRQTFVTGASWDTDDLIISNCY